MELTVLQDPDELSERAGPYLLAHEAEHNVILGHLAHLSGGWTFGGAAGSGPVLCLVENAAGVAAAAVCVAPRNLAVSLARSPAAMVAMARGLHGRGVVLPGVFGPAAEASTFAGEWARLGGLKARRAAVMEAYRLDSVRPPANPAPGRMRPGTAADAALVARWIAAFNEEAMGEAVADRAAARALAEELVAHRGRSIFLWDHGTPVAMAATGVPTPNGGRIYAVYTPPTNRGRGYATTLVAQLSQRVLDGGRRWCFLFADVENPTSNRIYRRMGYEAVAPMEDYRFE